MRKVFLKFTPAFCALLLLIFNKCSKDSDPIVPSTGYWYGTDVSFVVIGNPLRVNQLIFTYSGHASGSYCSFDYKSTVTVPSILEIDNNTFFLKGDNYDVSGKFTSDKAADIEISWSGHDTYCEAMYSDKRTCHASFMSTVEAESLKTYMLNYNDIIKTNDSKSTTIIIKKYQ
jgi:hypothetical protein